jgi:predicted ATPase/DNA-binding SARP family transcriptional activator
VRDSSLKTAPARMIESLEIRLLGPFDVLAGGHPASVSGSKRHALLALLALRRGRVVGVDALVDALWGEDLPAAPRNAVQHHVARLRAALGPDSIVASPDGYMLPDATVDALRFEELLAEARAAMREGDARAGADAVADALALWRGPALHGLADTEWFRTEARRLEALRVDALEEHFEAALALGQQREIVSALRATIEEDPFRERLWGQLMLALYRCGRQADALETFQEARRVLSEQLALEPGPELRRLQEAILSHDPAIAPVPAAPARRGNLPASSTSFVDREEALARIVELLREHRLVTLTGPPGVGKSRLALEALRSVEGATADGVWWVDLARASSAEHVASLFAQAVDARGPDPLIRVLARLRNADAVLLLDACEHVLEEAARVASAVLTECRDVRVLATSREVLHLAGEVRIQVEPLPLAAEDSTDAVDSPAVRLFLARASAARPGFELTVESAALAAEITRHVDGLPLGIELAAARLNVLGLAELLSIVERRLALLDGRPTHDPSRTALQGLVEWSYDLLHADEKALLQQVAVHRGGASLPALVAVGASQGLDGATVTYLLGGLVDKSIVLVSFPDGDARYDLLDTIRDYVLERLAESGGLAAARKAHAEYVASLADAAYVELRGPGWRACVRRPEREHDNLWAALAYALEAPDPSIAIRLAAVAHYFSLAERVSEGRRFLEQAMAAAPDDAPLGPRLELLGHLCYLATEELDVDAAIEIGEGAVELAAAGAARANVGLVEGTLALALAASGEERASATAEQATADAEAAGDDWEIAVCCLFRAIIAARTGDVSTVAAMAAAAYRHAGAIGFEAFQVPAALLEAWVAGQRNEAEAAVEAFERALDLAGDAGFGDHAAFALAGLGSIAFASGDLEAAAELQRRALAAAEAARSAWATAHAQIELARVLAATGDADTAEKLYRNVVEWSETPRPHHARESLFLALAGDPAVPARAGLAGLAARSGETARVGSS